jgi:hypothetical protein
MVAGMEVSEVEGAAMGLSSTEDVTAAVTATAGFSGFLGTGDVAVAAVASPWDAVGFSGFSSTGDVAVVVTSPTAFMGSGDTVAVGKGGSTAGECRDGPLVDVPGVVVG